MERHSFGGVLLYCLLSVAVVGWVIAHSTTRAHQPKSTNPLPSPLRKMTLGENRTSAIPTIAALPPFLSAPDAEASLRRVPDAQPRLLPAVPTAAARVSSLFQGGSPTSRAVQTLSAQESSPPFPAVISAENVTPRPEISRLPPMIPRSLRLPPTPSLSTADEVDAVEGYAESEMARLPGVVALRRLPLPWTPPRAEASGIEEPRAGSHAALRVVQPSSPELELNDPRGLTRDPEIVEEIISAELPKLAPPVADQLSLLPPATDVKSVLTASTPTPITPIGIDDELTQAQPQPSRLPEVKDIPRQPSAAMENVERVSRDLIQHAMSLATRGAHASARAEFIQVLRQLALGLDEDSGTREHAQALADALLAMDEASDFRPRGSRLEANLDMAMLVARHETPLFGEDDVETLSPLRAMQQYYTFAQQKFVVAAGGRPAASQALYGLGKLQPYLAKQRLKGTSLAGAKSMTYYKASLAANHQNHRAANELGVLLARYGQFAQAGAVLQHGLTVQSNPELLHNLSVVRKQMGQHELAQQAERQRQVLLAQQTAPTSDSLVRWVEPQVLNGSSTENLPPTNIPRRGSPEMIGDNPTDIDSAVQTAWWQQLWSKARTF